MNKSQVARLAVRFARRRGRGSRGSRRAGKILYEPWGPPGLGRLYHRVDGRRGPGSRREREENEDDGSSCLMPSRDAGPPSRRTTVSNIHSNAADGIRTTSTPAPKAPPSTGLPSPSSRPTSSFSHHRTPPGPRIPDGTVSRRGGYQEAKHASQHNRQARLLHFVYPGLWTPGLLDCWPALRLYASLLQPDCTVHGMARESYSIAWRYASTRTTVLAHQLPTIVPCPAHPDLVDSAHSTTKSRETDVPSLVNYSTSRIHRLDPYLPVASTTSL